MILFTQQRTDKEIADESNREMARFDQLGPAARQAVRNSPRILDIGKVVSDFKTKRDPSEWDNAIDGYPELNLQDKETDLRLANRMNDIVRQATGASIDDCVLERGRRT